MSRVLKLTPAVVFGCWLPVACWAQVNSGSNGSDGAFNPTVSTVISMATHPNGIYQYTSVNIPANVTVTFTPNANNTPVVWLVQGSVVINGTVDVSGQSGNVAQGGRGGPGGWCGGNGGPTGTSGYGPGGGQAGTEVGAASYGTQGVNSNSPLPPAPVYGNVFLLPLLGGSGGGGMTDSTSPTGGGGGGGAILIAASGTVMLAGTVLAKGGDNGNNGGWRAGGGSGGAVRLVASTIGGAGVVSTSGGGGRGTAGLGRVRFDSYENDFVGSISGAFAKGSQFIIIPTSGQVPQLAVTSVGGVPVSPSPTGVLSTPDAVLSAQQNNPIPIVVQCSNLPLNTPVTVSVKPANGSAVSAVGYNNTGTQVSSTATVSLNMPRGGGLIYATAATGN